MLEPFPLIAKLSLQIFNKPRRFLPDRARNVQEHNTPSYNVRQLDLFVSFWVLLTTRQLTYTFSPSAIFLTPQSSSIFYRKLFCTSPVPSRLCKWFLRNHRAYLSFCDVIASNLISIAKSFLQTDGSSIAGFGRSPTCICCQQEFYYSCKLSSSKVWLKTSCKRLNTGCESRKNDSFTDQLLQLKRIQFVKQKSFLFQVQTKSLGGSERFMLRSW